jgi:UDP-galactopyranose mutase
VSSHDVIVVGGGISGLAFAHYAAQNARRVLVLEAEPRLGGCIDSRRLPSGYWYELGAHTCYNSYGDLLDLLAATGTSARMVPRGAARRRFALARDGALTVMGPLSVFLQFDLLELAAHVPRALWLRREGSSARQFFGGIVGPGNYEAVLGPFLAAVPSQRVDDFPAAGPGSLFKKRPRRKELPRSFTFAGGLSTVAEALAARPGIECRTGVRAEGLRRDGGGFVVRTADGVEHGAAVVALAVPPPVAASLCSTTSESLRAALAAIRTVEVESWGVVLPRAAVHLPEVAFVVPQREIYFSAVSRDPVSDAEWRGFAFHFSPGHRRDDKLRRITSLLQVFPTDFVASHERRTLLPAPAVGHDRIVAAIDQALAGDRLAVVGNFFGGMAIEDCVARAKSEWQRVANEVSG